jgi:Dockerin type I domain
MNNGDSTTRRDGEELKSPAKLVAALKEPPARRVFVPSSVDAAVLRAARQQSAGSSTSPSPSDGERARVRDAFARFLRPWLLWPTVATACIVLAGLAYLASHPSSQPQFAREDVNHDGSVDILDAFQLARNIQSGAKPVPEVDLNGDGIVDRRDAELIATHAVKLEKGGKS